MTNENIEQIKTANVFQMTANLKLKVKTKSNHQKQDKNYFLPQKIPQTINYMALRAKLLKIQFSRWPPPP